MNITPSCPPTPLLQRCRAIVKRHPLQFYFLLAYGGSWLIWLPSVFAKGGLGLLPFSLPWPLTIYSGVYLGPALAGIAMTAVCKGRPGLHSLLRRCIHWQVGWQWYLFALIGIPFIKFLGSLVLPGVLPTFQVTSLGSALLSYLALLIPAILLSGLPEEIGWRGFALPRLQQRYGALLGSLILGILWGSWHLPMFFTSWEPAGTSLFTLCTFILGVTAASLLITWVFNRTQANLLIVMLIHGAQDAFNSGLLLSYPPGSGKDLGTLIAYGVAAILLLLMTRGQLGMRKQG
ncbi:CPBP family intramembrane metalloprotease [Ktedonosporobacter rubrisoli]|uniref:CPBP family intramembrane metalloprotease n=1 Tax=Ktedonosporobacter rubrisoli TaxID=2509675 RepID=A0A4V0Z0A4_KTERU|nr:type II CAAX endopeptidase family protein [Ktedonosporobacter rubrisoli]QBD82531.1 CPBP family intramembrane metalloprotease [Ktedonosporobacter rubrisoli]